MDIVTVRNGPTLVPATRFDLDELEQVRERQLLATRITFARSSPHWRWFNKLVAVVAEGIGMHRDQLYILLKYKTEQFKQIVLVPGVGPHIELQSFSYANADEIKFTQFRRAAVDILFVEYLPGVKRQDVYEKVEELTGEPCPW